MLRLWPTVSQLCRGLIGLWLVAACARNEPPAATGDPPAGGAEAASGAAAAPSGGAAGSPQDGDLSDEELGRALDKMHEKLHTPPVIRPSAEITVDGKPWGKPENIEIT